MKFKIDRKSAIKKVRTLVLTPKNDIDGFRKKVEKKFKIDILPNRVEYREKILNGIKCDILTPEIFDSNRIMIYIHGGSFAGGSRESWRSFCATIANASSARVILPDFRLPPTYNYPASVEDIENVFFAALTEEKFRKLDTEDKDSPTEVIVAGDGSGANLVLSFLIRLDTNHRKQISKAVLISPWLDLCPEKKHKDEVISWEDIKFAADLYTTPSVMATKELSPARAEISDFNSFPEIYIQNGKKEFLLHQSEEFIKKAESAGIKCIHDVVPDMFYMFQMADEYLKESSAAIDRIGHYINRTFENSEDEIQERNRLIKENNISVE